MVRAGQAVAFEPVGLEDHGQVAAAGREVRLLHQPADPIVSREGSLEFRAGEDPADALLLDQEARERLRHLVHLQSPGGDHLFIQVNPGQVGVLDEAKLGVGDFLGEVVQAQEQLGGGDQFLRRQSPGVEALLGAVLGQRADAVIGGEAEHVFVLAHRLVEEFQHVGHDLVRTQRGVEHLLRVGTPAVADAVVAGETDAQQVGHVVLAEFLGNDRLLDEFQQKFIAIGRVVERLVIGLGELLRSAVGRVREDGALPGALALADALVHAAVFGVVDVGAVTGPVLVEPAVDDLAVVELVHPGMDGVAVKRRRDDFRVRPVEPVDGIGLLADRQHRRAILERQADHLALALGGDLQGIPQGRGEDAVGAADALFKLGGCFFALGLLRFLGLFRVDDDLRGRGHPDIPRALGAIDRHALLAVVPGVADDAVHVRPAPGEHGGMPGPGDGDGVGIVAVDKPGAVFLHPDKAVRAEQRPPLVHVIAAHLVEHDQHDQFGLLRFAGKQRRGEQQGNQRQ